MSGHPGYLKLLGDMRELHIRKAADYGRGADPFANVRASADFGIPAWVGVMIRANDKVHRIKSFLANGNLKNESVEDSLMDLAAYSLIALVLYREGQADKPADGPRLAEGTGPSLDDLRAAAAAAYKRFSDDPAVCRHGSTEFVPGCRNCELWQAYEDADRAYEAAGGE
jgi:hypothetical protein